MKKINLGWVENCIASGLSSGEGLIYAVRDPLVRKEQIKVKGKYTGDVQEVTVDFGVDDKRLFVIEGEFVQAFKVMSREGNTLSAQIRAAWDHGYLRSLVKNSPYRASGAHISICGHISRTELDLSLNDCDFFNGFANRFLWACVQRSKLLPRGGNLDITILSDELKKLQETLSWAPQVEEMERDEDAEALWDSVYGELSAEIPGKFGAAVGRAEGQVLRISMIFALTDRSRIIRREHLQAALALWEYHLSSAQYLFLHRLDDHNAEKILTALRTHPEGMTRTQINVEVFGRNLSCSKIDNALAYLRRLKRAEVINESTNGRTRQRWLAISNSIGNEINEFDEE